MTSLPRHVDTAVIGAGQAGLTMSCYLQRAGRDHVVLDRRFPRQGRGVSEVPGLYFIGSLWQHDMASATLFGLPRDARFLAARMGLRTEER